jgi:ribonucleoside-triphosphate reductase (thioredoxin)
MDDLARYIHISKYARYNEELGRRETFEETVDRYISFFKDHIGVDEATEALEKEIKPAVLGLKVMPSMRALWSAGKALARDQSAGFNCAGAAITSPRVFDELFYLLMCGCGVGFSVERQHINQLPTVAGEFYPTDTTIMVSDSKIGWASSLRELISLLYAGKIPKWNLKRIRPAGARLKVFGGRASGPLPLDKLFKGVVQIFQGAAGRKLNSLECHDLMCKIANAVIVGSVRRSAMISFSNLSDDRCRRAKAGSFWLDNPDRALANNSVMYTEKPDLESYTKEWRSMYKSRSGERGMVNQETLVQKARECGRVVEGHDFLLNPCGEAILRSTGGFCNLTEVVVRPNDSLDELKDKVRLATIMGLLQSTLTDFRYLSAIWKKNAEEDRLLGVSLTGILDHRVLGDWKAEFQGEKVSALWLREMKKVAQETNKEWAELLGINPAGQLTLVKPSGTVSLLVDTAAGLHPRYAPYFIRRVTQDNKDPLTQMMISEGVPHIVSGDKTIFSFPRKSPGHSVCIKDIGPLEQLELWKIYQQEWCDGNPSQSIYYTDKTFLDVQAWVYRNWDNIGGLSFFPYDNHCYENAPYEEISEEKYQELLAAFPGEINWSRLVDFEKGDNTVGSQEIACSGGQCDLA